MARSTAGVAVLLLHCAVGGVGSEGCGDGEAKNWADRRTCTSREASASD